MTIKTCAAGRDGFVRGVVSRRHAGVVFPVDLVRVVARAVSCSALQRRLDLAFSDYLVSEQEPVFSGRRSRHSESFEFGYECMTGGWQRLDGWWAIDAPRLMAAGSMKAADFGGFASVVERHGLWS